MAAVIHPAAIIDGGYKLLVSSGTEQKLNKCRLYGGTWTSTTNAPNKLLGHPQVPCKLNDAETVPGVKCSKR